MSKPTPFLALLTTLLLSPVARSQEPPKSTTPAPAPASSPAASAPAPAEPTAPAPAASAPAPAATPPPKPTKAQLQAEFEKADRARTTLAEKTKERADASKAVSHQASDIAWLAFDEKKFEEAATWFARSASLQKESHEQAKAYWEEELRTSVTEAEKKLTARIKEFEAQLAAADTDEKKQSARSGIDSLEKIKPVMRYNAISMLQGIARDARDTEGRVKYSEQELVIRHAELEYLLRSGAAARDVQLKQVEVATALGRLAAAQGEAAQFEAAEKNLGEALAIRSALPETVTERRLDEVLSAFAYHYYHHVGDLAKARDYYQRALADRQASAAARQKALAIDPWSPELKAKMTAEQLANHETNMAQNRDLSMATSAMSECTMLNNLGSVTQESGDLTLAGSYYERALKTVEALPKDGYLNIFELARAQIRARTLGDLADLHAESGQVEKALQELDEAIKIKRALGKDENTANSLQQAAQLHFDKGDLETAKQYVLQARQIFVGAHRLSGVVAANSFLAAIAREAGQLDEAARYAEEALPLAVKTGNYGSLSGVARTFASIRLKQGKLAEAKALLEQATTADARTSSVSDRISTLGLTGELFAAEGNNEKALENYTEAVKLLESVRATAASEEAFADVKRNTRPYERIVLQLLKMNRNEEAFDYLNRAKSKKLRDQMPASSLKSVEKATQSKLDRVAVLENKIEKVEAQLQSEQAKPEAERDGAKINNLKLIAASTNGEYNEVVDDITSANPDWEKSMTMKPLELAQTQKAIPPGVVFLQYAPLGDQLYVFVVTRTTLKIYTPPVVPAELFKKIKAVRRQITTGETGAALTKNLYALYDMLIAPIEPELATIQTIAFIPNKLLFYLPLQALAKKQPDGQTRYLIEDKQIVYLTGADVMRAVQPLPEGKAPGGMLAFGNPTGADLPAAEVEVRTIATVFPGTDALFGGQVTKDAVSTEKLLEKRIVHFATHGVLNSAKPRDSYLQLAAGGAPEKQRLTVKEIWSLPMEMVEIVTLSACETAVCDKEPDGGEITTLAEAFARAKVRTVVASLWSVGDESTKEFMVAFYQLLAAGVPKAEALQKAQIKMLKNPQFSRPLYWAPFVLMGDWR